jgi:hypothetical protein
MPERRPAATSTSFHLYSHRKETMGSTRPARRAGMKTAKNNTTTSMNGISAKVAASVAVMLNCMQQACRRRMNAMPVDHWDFVASGRPNMQ